MLPIIPIQTSKQKKTTSATVRKRRPRALLTSTAVAASKQKKKKTKSSRPEEANQKQEDVVAAVDNNTDHDDKRLAAAAIAPSGVGKRPLSIDEDDKKMTAKAQRVGGASTTNVEGVELSTTALKEPSSSTVQHQQQKQHPHGKNNVNNFVTNNNLNDNDDEDPLALAAEAAAALMDDLPQHATNNNNSYVDNIPMGLLDESVNFAATEPEVDDGNTKEGLLQEGEEEEEGAITASKAKEGTSSTSQASEQQRKNLNSIAQSSTRRKFASTEYELSNPLGKNVQTFTTGVPTSSSNTTADNSLQVMTMSAAQKNFISHYYYNNGVEGSMDNAILGGSSNKNSSKKGGDDDDDEDDEEIVDTDDKRKSDNMAAREGGVGVSSEKENMTKEKEGGEGDDEASAVGGGSGGKKHISTLRSVCQSIPRSMKRKDPKNDKLKRGRRKKQKKNGDGAFDDDGDVDLLPNDEQVNVMQIVADPTTAVGDSGMGVANNVKDATASDQQSTDQQPQEEDETAVVVGPQVEVDEHGQIVIAQDSLLPNPETRQSTAQIDQEFGNNVVDEGETPARLGAIQARYDSYTTTPRQKPARWSVDETKLFYRALRQCGTDFTMMQMFLVGRTRSQLKSKFKIEGRKNARLVDMALNPRSKVKLDLSVFGDLEIPEEVPPLRVLQSPVSPVADAATGGREDGDDDQANYQQGGSRVNNHGSMESTFDHLFDEEEEDGPDAAADHKGGKDTSQEMRKGKTEEGGQVQQALAPVIAPPGPKAKVKKPFRPSKKGLAKKSGSVATKKK